MTPAIRIRALAPGDLPFCHGLAGRLAGVADLPWRTPAAVADFQQRFMADCLDTPPPGSAGFIALDAAGDRLGFIQVQPLPDGLTGEPAGYVSLLAVTPAAEGKGVARALMTAAEDHGREQGWTSISLDVFASNTRGRRFYASLGYGEETLRLVKPLADKADA